MRFRADYAHIHECADADPVEKFHPRYPRINICKKITFFGLEVGQLDSIFNSEYQNIIIVHPFLVLSFFRNTSPES